MKDIVEIEDKKIIIKGIGKLYYQEGLPMGIAAQRAIEMGYTVSWLHVADELLKEGWRPDRIIPKFREEIEDDNSSEIDIKAIEKFVYSTYEEQRQMIFNSLFSSREVAKEWLIVK